MTRFSLPTITVVIPTRDRPQYLQQAVQSVLSQSIAAYVIAVDDGAGAADALSGFPDTVRVLDNRRRGPVAARSLGVAAAQTDCIAFLDDDDWFQDVHHLERAAQAIVDGASLSFSDGTLKFDSGAPDVPFAFAADAVSLEANNTILISAVVYERALHARLGDFDHTLPYYWDWDWYLRVARSGARLAHIAAPMVAIRVHDANMSGDANATERRENLDRLSAKHGLPPIPLKNHASIAVDHQRTRS